MGSMKCTLSLTTNAGFIGEAGSTWSLGISTDGSYGVTVSNHVGGIAGWDIGLGGEVGYSTAETWSDTGGTDVYLGVGTKVGVGADITLNAGEDGSKGVDIGVSAGPPNFNISGGVDEGRVVFERNIKEDLNAAGQAINNAIDSALDFTIQGTQNLTDKIKEKWQIK